MATAMKAPAIAALAASLLAAACGGRAITGRLDAGTADAAGDGDASDSAGEAPITPRFKEGVPIGDCEELGPAELAARGCPPTPPSVDVACNVPKETVCGYSIKVEGELSSQVIYTCPRPFDGAQPRWFGWTSSCGVACPADQRDSIPIDGPPCAERPIVSCGEGRTYAIGTTAHRIASDELGAHIAACGGGSITGVTIHLEVKDGCPVRLFGLGPPISDCLKERLSNLRWRCAMPLVCANYGIYLL
jgi:hypothetical protein